ncbi:MAG: hypothetical protein PHI59_05520 [Candidatus Omnitrophica bacterium]|nr:hypothetical protein [Candidatus Omnitrophota bacterium]
MDKIINDYEQFIKILQRSWHSIYGLILSIIALTFIHIKITMPFFNSQEVFFPNNGNAIAYGQIAVYSLLFALIVFIWIWNRRIPKFSNRDIGILFCPSANEKLGKESERLKNSLQVELNKLGLKFKIRNLPTNHLIKDLPAAHKLREASNCHLIIWGLFEEGKIKNTKTVGFPQIYFTYKMPQISHHLVPLFSAEIGIGVIGKKWYFDQENDFFEIEMLSKNITEASLNIIGKVLLVSGKFDTSIKVLTVLLVEHLEPKRQSATPLLRAFIASTEFALSFAYYGKAKKIYDDEVFTHLDEDSNVDTLNQALDLVSNAIKYHSRNGDYYLLKAIYTFLLNRIPESRDPIMKAIQFSLRSSGVPHLSGAFIYMFDGDIERGLRWYRKASKRTVQIRTAEEVIHFIKSVLKKCPSKIQLHLALAVINNEWLDPKEAKNEFGIFIKEAARANVCDIKFIDYARSELSKLSK